MNDRNSSRITSGILLLFLTALLLVSCKKDPIERSVDKLISKMTLEEKVGQMTNIGLTAVCKGPFWSDADSIELDSAKLEYLLLEHHIGSIQNKGKYPPSREEWNRIIRIIQDYNISKSRLGIPVLMGIDAVHGANYTAASTLFPHQIACAATWDTEHSRKIGEITSYELRASSIPWNYAPVLDVSFQPLWGRIFETYGEDPYLAGMMGLAFIEGSQGEDVSDPYRTAVCLKHFVGYGTPVTGKDRSPAIISDIDLWQYYIPPFKSAIDAGALTIMLNSGSINGIPGHINHHLITEVLKGELGFKGLVISDWEDISKLVGMHNVAADRKEAVRLSVMAGMDMCMVPYDESFATDLVELVKEGKVPMSRIDDAVRRILYVKYRLGLFDRPYSDPEAYEKFGSDQFAEASYEAAKECITLLKNSGNILPLDKRSTVLVTGPTSNTLNHLNGAWSRTWDGVSDQYNDKGKLTVMEAIAAKLGSDRVAFSQGSHTNSAVNIKETAAMAKKYDAVIICLGEDPSTEKPSDIDELDIPDVQTELVKELAKSGKPLIVVLLEGRPRIIRELEPLADAIIMAYVPGQEGGRAIADVLFGDHNPSGKLPYTYPRYSGSIWRYNHKASDEMDNSFRMKGFTPQYQFGEGLSYTTFNYSDFALSRDTITGDEQVGVTVSVTNNGTRKGKEVIQLYIRDLVASVAPDVRKLVRFSKIELAPGETKEVSFMLDKKDLSLIGIDNKWVTETGRFKLFVGGNPKELLENDLYYIQKK